MIIQNISAINKMVIKQGEQEALLEHAQYLNEMIKKGYIILTEKGQFKQVLVKEYL